MERRKVADIANKYYGLVILEVLRNTLENEARTHDTVCIQIGASKHLLLSVSPEAEGILQALIKEIEYLKGKLGLLEGREVLDGRM